MTKVSMPLNDSMRASDRIPWWVSIVVILGAILLSVGAVISKVNPMMLTNGGLITDAARVFADYMFARNLPLALSLLFLLAIKSRRMLAGFMVLIAFIQFVDVLNDLARGALLLAPGLLLFAIIFLIAAQKLFGQSIWKVDTWHEPVL